MCPSTCIPLAAENEYWTDEGIFMSLFNFKCGKPLPMNVTSDVNPYKYKPSDLPVDLWYLCSGVNKDAECGYWFETGESREIFSNSAIIGYRTTLQYYEGRLPHGRKTDWVMQEYKITDKCNNNMKKDHRSLCRVFSADGKRSPYGHFIANIDVKISINLGPTTISNMNNREHVSTRQLMEKTMGNNTGPSLMTTTSQVPFLGKDTEMDCILRGDYFELNDLIDPVSCSSSSTNSSCLSMTSDEYFDSMALLQELDEDATHQDITVSSVKFNLSAPVKSKEVVIHPASLVSLRNDEDCKPAGQKTYAVENKNQNSSNGSYITTASLSSSENTSKDWKKENASGIKRRKVMKYLCCLAF
ncbi:no apical meristem protein [Tanacetum coccineum]